MVRAIGCLASFPLVAALACSDDAALGGDESSGSGGSSGTSMTADPDGSDSSAGMTASSVDGSSSGVTDTSSSSGPAPELCGNGELDEGEGCDDGDLDDGDACRADCTIAFEVAWTQLHNGRASNADAVSDLWIDAAGNTYALGRERSAGDGEDLWLQQYLPDGSEGPSFTLGGPFGGDDAGIALAPTTDGDLIVVGRTEVGSDDADAWVLRITPELDEVIWQASFVGPFIGESNDGASAVLPTDDGLYVVGRVAPDGTDGDAWVARLDEVGGLVWEATFDDELHLRNDATGVLPDDNGGVIVFGSSTEPYTRGGFALRYDGDGVAQGEPVTFDLSIGDVVADGEGGYVLAGYGDSRNAGLDAVVRKLDGDLAEVWSVSHDGDLSFDFGEAVALDGAGNVYLVGQVARTGQQGNGFIMAYDSGGAPLWGDEYNTADVDLEDVWQAIAVDPDGDVVVGGYATILGHQSDGFVRRYHPL